MRRIACVVLLTLNGCGILGPDWDVTNRRPMDPVPATYSFLYEDVEGCLGQRGNFGAVRWFVADVIVVDGQRKSGVLRFPNEITMSSYGAVRDRPVRHEMAHHITGIGDALHDEWGSVPCEH